MIAVEPMINQGNFRGYVDKNNGWTARTIDEKMFNKDHDIRIRAFIKSMKKESPEKLVQCIIKNQKKGIEYGYQKDYDLKKSEDEVICLLLTGRNE